MSKIGKTKIELTADYTFAEFPQYGGKITEGKKGEVHEVSLEIAEVIIKEAKKGKRVGEEVKTEAEKSESTDETTGNGTGEDTGEGDDKKDESLVDKIKNANPFTKDKDKAESD